MFYLECKSESPKRKICVSDRFEQLQMVSESISSGVPTKTLAHKRDKV